MYGQDIEQMLQKVRDTFKSIESQRSAGSWDLEAYTKVERELWLLTKYNPRVSSRTMEALFMYHPVYNAGAK